MPFLFILIGVLVVLIILMFFGHIEIVKELQVDIKEKQDKIQQLESELEQIKNSESLLTPIKWGSILKRRVEKLSTLIDPVI